MAVVAWSRARIKLVKLTKLGVSNGKLAYLWLLLLS
jgi:hypothetical protein